MSIYSNGSITFGGGIVPPNLRAGGGANSGSRLLQQSVGVSAHENVGLAPDMGMDFGSSATASYGGSIGQIWNQGMYNFIHSFH